MNADTYGAAQHILSADLSIPRTTTGHAESRAGLVEYFIRSMAIAAVALQQWRSAKAAVSAARRCTLVK
jgi:hypothetical protein